jgi:hypothetical protein
MPDMIRFACKQCGKRHQQPPEASGSLIFCECGQANRVPWESTLPDEPERERREEREPARRSRRRSRRRTDPTRCLNHEDADSVKSCADCGEAFCERCLVEFRGIQLCGPCKNYRVRRLQRLPQITGLNITALVVGLCSAPIIFCTLKIPISNHEPKNVIPFGLLGVVIGGTAALLGLWGLRDAERKAVRGGQGLAMIGTALGTAGLLWSLSLVLVVASRVL